ncbi:pseudaminic acid synthase [Colwellia echini]|uniref:Pseudaminic acid synthase n=1 Tax=Colwellia echini TaxID=1982103 RepID=A0ABY3MWJ7_9GAMM|nr:pseudaminic acid synthase [Colwellia echini]TYK65597.1 pseudaminic acid synthase [Colwellia echini]
MTFKNSFEINGRSIGEGIPVYIIAEMSANHGQDLGRAKELVYAAKEAGADAIKLQTYTADTLTMDCKLPHFEAQGAWKGQYLYDLYKGAYMPWDFHKEIIELANSIGITCFSSPFDNSAVDLLESFDSPAYKIASPEIIDHELIRYVAKTGKPIIMSTGGATLAEIAEAVQIVESEGATELCLLKCTSTYPAPAESINLRTIPHLGKSFQCPVGLSDHTLGNDVPIASVAFGACVIEKHFVMSKDDETADSFFSMTPDELKALVHGVRQVEKAIGQVDYPLTTSTSRRCLYVIKDIQAGEMFTRDNIANLRPGGGELMPKDIIRVLGRKSGKHLTRGTQLSWQHLA